MRPPDLVLVPGGAFLMGSESGRADERPVHRVRLPDFLAGRAPVTNAEYTAFVAATGTGPARFSEDPRFNAPGQPVVGVNWHEAVAYCLWLADRTGLRLRLPSEAEREYASLGGLHGASWPWGSPRIEDHPAYAGLACLDRPHPPLDACRNGYGLLCMADNVHEWCADWYDPAYYAVSPEESPAGPPSGLRKVSRGGSWRHQIKFTRIAARAAIDPSFRYNDYGFRVYGDV
jgi:sulfatase modifying factor 1